MSILDYGAGASEGLDRYLTRMMAQEQLAETARAHKAQEANVSEGLKQNDWLKQSLAEERAARTAGMADAQRKEAERQAAEDAMLKDPEFAKTPQGQWLKLRRVEPNAPFQLFQEGGGVNSEQKAYKLTDPSLAKQFGKKVGDPIDAAFNPRSQKITYRGVDITNGVDHYEKPPQPDRVLIQTDEGYMPRDKARQKLDSGGSVPLATTGSTRTMMEGAKMLKPHIAELSGMADRLDKAGLFGPAMSRVRHVAESVGSIDDFYDALQSDPELQKDPLVGEFSSSLGLMATGAGRVHGGARGGSSAQMLAHFKSLLNDSSTAQMFKGRLAAVDSYMKGYAAGPNGSTEQGEDTGGVPRVGGTFNGGKVLKVTPIQ